MRLVHLSDLHLGFRQFQRQTPAGINQREADVAAVFRSVIDRVIELAPDVVLFAGDIFHNVRPPNPAILHAFQQFARLMAALPDAIVVMIAGDHDTPRSVETGCILRLFTPLGIHVVEGELRRLSFPERNLSILAIPDTFAPLPRLTPDPDYQHNILVLHGRVPEIMPDDAALADRSSVTVNLGELNPSQWTYVALGHYHVLSTDAGSMGGDAVPRYAKNVYYSGSIEYTSPNSWGDKRREGERKLYGKKFIEFDLDSRRPTFHSIEPARALVELPPIEGTGMSAADIDAAVAANVKRCVGGIDDKIVRQMIWNVPRHIARELDQKAQREYRHRALHFHLDTRRPDIQRPDSASGAPGRRPSLFEIVRDKLRSRPLPGDIDRDQLVELGLQYLREAEARDVVPAAGAGVEES